MAKDLKDTSREIVEQVLNRQLHGVMFHNDMTTYFEFLTLPGFAELQRYRYADELKTYHDLHDWFMQHYNCLPIIKVDAYESPIPSDWYKYDRHDVTVLNRQNGIKDGFKMWIQWEEDTRKIFSANCMYLVDPSKGFDDCPSGLYIAHMVEDVSNEVADAEEIAFELAGMNYDMPTIISMQGDYVKKYHKKLKHLI